MPQKRSSQEPPPVMTWGKAVPVLAVAVIFDALRLMCEWLWVFGPALAGLYCVAQVGDTAVVGGLLATACTAGAAATGVVGVEVLMPLGVVLAMGVGLLGWLTVGLILLMTNGRIFKENAMVFAASLLVSEVPLINSLPALTGIIWRMYHVQIRTEKEDLKRYQEQRAAEDLQEQRRQAAAAALIQERALEQEAANEEEYAETENDEESNPQGMEKAA
jgi:hypothetical protein